MLVIYGLGNNESKYFDTKHNIGRVLLEIVNQEFGVSLSKKNDFLSAKLNQNAFALCSNGYMNESGLPLINFINYYKLIDPTILILQDDSDQFTNKAKLLIGGGSAGHHGINSIFSHLPKKLIENKRLWRLKIGIRPDGNRLRSETFVLNSLDENDKKNLPKLREIIIKEIITKGDFESAQNQINCL